MVLTMKMTMMIQIKWDGLRGCSQTMSATKVSFFKILLNSVYNLSNLEGSKFSFLVFKPLLNTSNCLMSFKYCSLRQGSTRLISKLSEKCKSLKMLHQNDVHLGLNYLSLQKCD